ncbi:LOW QUALITY PROTEIN: EC28 protein [Colletotrichum higginsianum IMI 349063]|uniref:EC28 protein n=1 Tax=Colletotrichum higginsianum (strain IMI 349063) TaxID=759273 RepID=A0A1B7Y827_COLHI|nr:LOW QUALITY PROTEIN: EC28 protein [Colletotrichum higginsianum IMI 349063]OBR08088.1 LOW QUALITY PROTEIN: EC28 protein [Colletotrichum higginsianum IMI 349063]GJC97820.1 EC28 protein [Colletotrichum higginsianum]
METVLVGLLMVRNNGTRMNQKTYMLVTSIAASTEKTNKTTFISMGLAAKQEVGDCLQGVPDAEEVVRSQQRLSNVAESSIDCVDV